MKRNAILIIMAMILDMVLFAQTDTGNYDKYRKWGLTSLENKKYPDALRQLAAAKEEYDCAEIQQDIKRANDLIDAAYDRAIKTYKINDKTAKQRAILMFSELIDVRHESYAYIGQCYYLMGDNYLAADNFKKGVSEEDPLSALYYAKMLQKTEPGNIAQRISLYKKAIQYDGVKDSLGVEYERLNNVDSAYYWYSKSTSDYSKYQRACLLLNPANRNALTNINDDPIKLLEEVANNTSNESEKTIRASAVRYRGLLYNRQYIITKDEKYYNLSQQWIERAADMEDPKAIEMLKDKNKRNVK